MLELESIKKFKGNIIRQFLKMTGKLKTAVVCVIDKEAASA